MERSPAALHPAAGSVHHESGRAEGFSIGPVESLHRGRGTNGLKQVAGPLEVVAEGWRTGPTATLLVVAIEYVKLLFP
jgi:hypothetical protein